MTTKTCLPAECCAARARRRCELPRSRTRCLTRSGWAVFWTDSSRSPAPRSSRSSPTRWSSVPRSRGSC
ncbi:hypothetical protein PUN28_007591 [Cardiocondyla obscurior]|uniref:Uncharacterized protein n=1 Tax=Cardiocondyla obscurior TaxID=286306 RepID=A0AAW2GAF0_9HYME